MFWTPREALSAALTGRDSEQEVEMDKYVDRALLYAGNAEYLLATPAREVADELLRQVEEDAIEWCNEWCVFKHDAENPRHERGCVRRQELIAKAKGLR